jgi:hypothetical protein
LVVKLKMLPVIHCVREVVVRDQLLSRFVSVGILGDDCGLHHGEVYPLPAASAVRASLVVRDFRLSSMLNHGGRALPRIVVHDWALLLLVSHPLFEALHTDSFLSTSARLHVAFQLRFFGGADDAGVRTCVF